MKLFFAALHQVWAVLMSWNPLLQFDPGRILWKAFWARRAASSLLFGILLALTGAGEACAQGDGPARIDARRSQFLEDPRSDFSQDEVSPVDSSVRATEYADEEGGGHTSLEAKIFTDEEKSEIERMFRAYTKAEADRKAQADKQKKDEPYEIGSDNKLQAVWNNGLWFQTAEKDWMIHLGGRIMWQSSFWDQPSDLNAPAPGGGGQPNSTAATRGVGQLQDGMFFRRV